MNKSQVIDFIIEVVVTDRFHCMHTVFTNFVHQLWKWCYFDDVFATGCIVSYQSDSSSQWRKFRQYDISVSMNITHVTHSRCFPPLKKKYRRTVWNHVDTYTCSYRLCSIPLVMYDTPLLRIGLFLQNIKLWLYGSNCAKLPFSILCTTLEI